MNITAARIINDTAGKPSSIRATIGAKEWFVPLDPGNRDYCAFLEWIEAGNEPSPADDDTALPADWRDQLPAV